VYRCTREEIEKAPTCGGLYLFYSADLDLLYIGKARNLRHRIKQHLFPRGTAEEASNTRKIKHRFHYVCFLPIQEEGDRREVERELIKKLNPKYNKQHGTYEEPVEEGEKVIDTSFFVLL